MKLLDIVQRHARPKPWEDVSKIPWDDPAFSKRMLQEHLTQDHDAASRRFATIDRQSQWIHEDILGRQPSRILDLGCGPGLYCVALAGRGHTCTGIDFAPASIEHARETASSDGLDCVFELGDLLTTSFGNDRDLIMLIFGEFNTFRRDDALQILRRSREALSPTGRMIVEVHTHEFVQATGEVAPTWSTMDRGLFSDQPHIRVNDAYWDEGYQTSIERHYVIDCASAEVSLYGTTTQAYKRPEYETLFVEAGFKAIEWRADWPNEAHIGELELVALGT